MRKDKPPYYRVRGGRAFFALGRERAASAGMRASIPLGHDNRQARAEAWKLYHQWLSECGRADAPKPEKAYPAGSLGSWLEHYRRTPAWRRKAPATRQEWEAAWNVIAPWIGDSRMDTITPTQIEAMYEGLESSRGVNIRWRAIKLTRALFNAAIKHGVVDRSPALTLPNTPPPPRKQFWYAAEVMKLIETAEAIGRPAMALAIRIGWDTLFQPVDVRTLTLSNRRRDGVGAYFMRQRSKTGAEAFAHISAATNAAIDAYVASLPFAVPDDQPFLRTPRGHAYRKARFLDDFAIVRLAAFGEDEKRRFQDIRRAGNIEADLGGASAEDRAAILANALDKDASLDATYTPPTVAKARELAAKRLEGRRILAGQSVNATGEGGN